MEKHEVRYIKRLAKNYLKKTKNMKPYNQTKVRIGSLRRLCKYALKLK